MADAASESYRTTPIPWAAFQTAWVQRVSTLAALYQPDYYIVIKEPRWYGPMISDATTNPLVSEPSQWVALTQELIAAVQAASPNTKIGVSIDADSLVDPQYQALYDGFIQGVSQLSGISFIGFDVYGPSDETAAQSYLAQYGSGGKDVWIAETWSNPDGTALNGIPADDASWMTNDIYPFAQSIGAKFLIPFYTDDFSSYSWDTSPTDIVNNYAMMQPVYFAFQSLAVASQNVAGSIRLTASEPGAPTAAFGLSGCNVSVDSVAGDGNAYSFTATPNCLITVTAPSGGAGSRYLFGGASPTGSFTTCASGTCSEQDFAYYYQLSQSAAISVTGGGSPGVSLSSIQFGASTPTALTTTATSVWMDYGTTASVPAAVTGAAGEQWTTSTASWSITSSDVIANPIAYQHQYQVTFVDSPTGAGTTTPSGTNAWVNAGALSISASSNAGYSFSSWSSSTGSITFASTALSGTTATVSASGTITANFNPALAAAVISVSASAIDSGQSASLTTSTSFSGGSPPYSCQWLEQAPGGTYEGLGGPFICSAGDTPAVSTGALSADGTWSFEFQVTDSARSPATATSAAVTVAVNSALIAPAISVAPTTIDSGQEAVLSTTASFAGGTPSYACQWLAEAPGGSYFDLGTSFGCSAGDTPATATGTLSIVGAWSFELQVTDGSGTEVTVASGAVTVDVNPQLAAPTLSASLGTINQGQSSSLTSSPVNTGTYPYGYQWLEEAPGASSFSPIAGATFSSYTFTTTSSTNAGTWSFELQVTDAAGASVTSTLAVTVNAVDPTAISVVPSPATVTIGTTVTFKATVTDDGQSPTTPSGTVTWSDGGAGGAFSSNTCALTRATSSSGSCSVTYKPPPTAEAVAITAGYSGDSSHGMSSGASALTVGRRSTSTSLSPSSTTVTVGSITTLTATVKDTSVGTKTAPTGTISWSDGGKGGTFSPATCTLSQTGPDSSKCNVTYTTSLAPAGSIKITAAYAGDGSHSKSSASATFTISKRTTTTAINPSSASVGSRTPTKLVVTVTDTSPGTPSAPTGSVTWTASVFGGSFTSGKCTLSAISATQSQCSVTYTSPSKAGTVTITARYNGDSTHLTSSGISRLTVA